MTQGKGDSDDDDDDDDDVDDGHDVSSSRGLLERKHLE